MQGTGDKGYISGDGNIVQFDPADRKEPVELTGTSLTGEPVDIADYRGKPLVVNVWWSGCGPCRSEMPMLVDASADPQIKADFLGINIRDSSAANGQRFAEESGTTYPSIYDPGGKAMLAFSGRGPLAAIPTTLILDAEGRVAAVVSGEIPSKITLKDLVEEAAAEDG